MELDKKPYKPARITAETQNLVYDNSTYNHSSTTPGVLIKVSFDHGDAAKALQILESSVSEIERQIKETM